MGPLPELSFPPPPSLPARTLRFLFLAFLWACPCLPPASCQLPPCLAACTAATCPHIRYAGVSPPGAGYGWLAGPPLKTGSAASCCAARTHRCAGGWVAPRQRTLRAALLPSRAASRTRKLEGPCRLPCRLLGGCRRLPAPSPVRSCCCLLPCLACWPVPPFLITRPAPPPWPTGPPPAPRPAPSPFLPPSASPWVPRARVPPLLLPRCARCSPPCLIGRSPELLCRTAGCCWPGVAAPLVGSWCPPAFHPPSFFLPSAPPQQLPLHPSVFLWLQESVDGAPPGAPGLLDFLSGLLCHSSSIEPHLVPLVPATCSGASV